MMEPVFIYFSMLSLELGFVFPSGIPYTRVYKILFADKKTRKNTTSSLQDRS